MPPSALLPYHARYDALNRLVSATNSGASPSWGQSFAYDGFGNMTQTNVTQGSAPTFAQTYNANNQVGNEDANGNPPSVPLPAYGGTAQPTYDVENRVVELYQTYDPIYYNHDPANHRVWRYIPANSPATDEITFWSITGQKLGTYQLTYTQGNNDDNGNQYNPSFTCVQTATNYYFGAKLIKDKNGWVYPDRLGSIGKFYPYGIERPSATTNGTEKFTGYFRDAESGNDYAVNRYESPGYGRFLTPDPYSSPSASDPGSWNKYAYVEGDPINRTDPSGQDWCSYGAAGSAFEASNGSCDGVGPDASGNCYIFNAMGMLEAPDVPGCTNILWGDPSLVNSGASGGSSAGEQEDQYPICTISLYEKSTPVPGSPFQHTFLVISETLASGNTETEVIEGEPQYIIPVGRHRLGFGKLVLCNNYPNGCYGDSATPSQTPLDSMTEYGADSDACVDFGLLSNWAQFYQGLQNSAPNLLSQYSPFPNGTTTFNSNSFTYTLLWDVGLNWSNVGNAPGWGDLVPYLYIPPL